MPLTEEQRNKLTKHGSGFHSEVVLTIVMLVDRLKTLEDRIKSLEEREPTQKLKLVANE